MNGNEFQQRIHRVQEQARKRFSETVGQSDLHETARAMVADAGLRQDTEMRRANRRRMLPTEDGLALERILGRNNLFHVNYFALGVRAIRAVGRVHVINEQGIPIGFGTGALVGDGLLVTNNHVLEMANEARRSFVEFDFEYDALYRPKQTFHFGLDPDALFVTHRALDFTFVAVRALDANGHPLSKFGFIRMIEDTGKALIGEPVSIIQHPRGGLKQVALRDSRIIGLAPNEQGAFLHYTTDTEPGSSGSPVVNDQWQMVALHHAGVPGSDGDWVANEGTRVSQIFEHLRQLDTDEASAVVKRMKEVDVDLAIPIDDDREDGPLSRRGRNAARSLVRVNGGEAEVESFTLDRWREVAGYRESFLGREARVPMPLPTDLSDMAVISGGGHVLKYHHFSVVMSRARRLAYVTAVNVDGSKLVDMRRRQSRWRLDPRLPGDLQIDNRCYKHNDLDRGHLVRRLTPVWGDDAEARRAEEDTFHYTNCAPQHKDLNQRSWLDLEDYILERVDWSNIRASVFTGPVFRPDDMAYRGEYQIPAEYWKVAAALDDAGRLTAAGYLQTQKRLISNMEAAFGDYKTYRVPVSLLAELTDLDFGPLVAADPRSRGESSESFTEIRGSEDIDFL